MSRLPGLRHDDLSPAARTVWDSIVATRGEHVVTADGALSGPFNAMVHAPGAGGPLASLGAALRFGTSLGRSLTEVAILTVASRWQAEFEWAAHAAIARQAGLSEEVIEAIARGDARPPFSDNAARTVHRAAAEIVTAGRLSQPAHEEARGLLGDAGVVELVALCGYYCTISFLLNSFEVPPPAGSAPRWPAAGSGS